MKTAPAIVFWRSSSPSRLLQTLSTQITDREDFSPHWVADRASLTRLAQSLTHFVLLVSTNDKQVVVDLLQALGEFEPRLRNGTIRAIAVNDMNHPKLASLLRAKGVTETVEPRLNPKAFFYKVSNHAKLVEQQFLKLQAETTLKGSGESRSESASSAREEESVRWLDPWENFADFWIVEKKRDARRVLGRWMIDLNGPGPSTGSWEPIELDGHAEPAWEFRDRGAELDGRVPHGFSWVFVGKQPEYDWVRRLWLFVGRRPLLALRSETGFVQERLRAETDSTLAIRENSTAALSSRPWILETVEASIRLQRSGAFDSGRAAFEAEPARAGFGPVSAAPEPARDWNFGDTSLDPETAGLLDEAFGSLEISVTIRSRNGVPLARGLGADLIEFTREAFRLSCAAKEIKNGDSLKLELTAARDGKPEIIEGSARVLRSGASEDGPVTLVCEPHPAFGVNLARVVDSVEAREEDMTEFFRKARGF